MKISTESRKSNAEHLATNIEQRINISLKWILDKS